MKMWIWDQSAGRLTLNGVFVSNGYAGKGRGKNNPALQGERGVGPLPRGKYRIGKPRNSERTGKFIMDLFPIDATPGDTRHDATGRAAFQIHGDSIRAPGTASSGCMILPLAIRQRIARSGDDILEVVE
jgi:hypothetical protein